MPSVRQASFDSSKVFGAACSVGSLTSSLIASRITRSVSSSRCVKLLAERQELGPERALLERFGCAHLHGAVPAAGFAKGLEAVAATERDEQLAFPGVGHAVAKLLVLLVPAELGETCTNAFGRSSRRLSLAVHRRPRVERLDLAQLLQQRTLERHHGDAPKHVCRRASAPFVAALATRRRAATLLLHNKMVVGYAATGGARSACNGA